MRKGAGKGPPGFGCGVGTLAVNIVVGELALVPASNHLPTPTHTSATTHSPHPAPASVAPPPAHQCVSHDALMVGARAAGMARGGKVNSTCCRVHKNAELVPDSARIRMHVRSTRQVRVDSEILVMYQVLTQAFSGECREGVGVVCARSAHQSVARRALAHRWAQWGASGVPVFEGANKLALIRNVQHACCSLKDDDVFYFVLAETKNRSQAPYIPLGRYVPYEAV